MYCEPVNSKIRKASIKFLNITLDILLRWFAPIISFTTEEIYKIIYNNEKSIHLENFPNIPSKWKNEKLFQKWNKLKAIRNVANAAIEIKRSSKEIGSSLEADIQIYLGEEYLKLVKDVDFEVVNDFYVFSKWYHIKRGECCGNDCQNCPY